MLKTKYFIGCLLFTFALVSCEEKESFDIKGDPGVKFFTNNPSPGNSPQNALNYSIVNTPNTGGSGLVNLSTTFPTSVKFPVYATKPVSEDVIIGAGLDNTLIADYNALHSTDYISFPAGMLTTTGLAAHIASGASTSVDSISIATNMTSASAMTKLSYMAPIRLTSVSDQKAGEIAKSIASQVVYIVASVELRRIKYLATPADALGTLVASRASWVATFNPVPSVIGNILDGSTTTYTRWPSSPGQLDVDLQTTNNVTGIRLYTSSSATYLPAQIYVYLSNDGINYDLIGSPLKANLTYATSYNYILFYKSVPARYVRLKMTYSTSTSSNNLRVAEFDLYTN